MAGQEITPPPPDAEIPPPPDYQPEQKEASREPISGWDWSNPKTLKDPQAQAAAKEQSRQGGVLAGTASPESLSEVALQGVGAIPSLGPVGVGGALAAKALPQIPRLAAAGGRAVTSGLLGAGKAAVSGGDPLAAGLRDTGMAAVWEGLLGVAPYLPKGGLAKTAAGLAGREREYQTAKDAVMQAYNKLKAFVPKGDWLDVPTISKKPISFLRASHGLEKLERAEFDAARAEIAASLKNAPSALGGPPMNPPVKASVALKNPAMQHPNLSEGFTTRTATTPFKPSATGFERAATNIVGTMRDPAVRAGVDVLANEGPDEMPLGTLPLAAGESGLKWLARRILR